MENSEQFDRLLLRCEKMINSGETCFFDVEEIQDLVFYFLEQNQIKKAFQILKIGKNLHENNFEIFLLEAECYAASGEDKKAIQLIKLIESNYSQNYEIQLAKSSIYSRLGDFDKTINILFDVLKMPLDKEEKSEVFQIISNEYFLNLEGEKSIEFMKKALLVDEENIEILFMLIERFIDEEKEKEGIKFLKNQLNLNINSKYFWNCLGKLYFSLGKFKKSFWAYEYSILIDNKYLDSIIGYIESLTELEEFHKLIIFLKNEIKKQKNNHILFFHLGYSYEQLENYTLAELNYLLAIKLKPDFIESWVNLSEMYFALKDFNKAISYVKKTISLDPKNPFYHLLYANILTENLQFEEAIEVFQKIIFEFKYESTSLYFSYCKLLYDTGKHEIAKEHLLRGIEISLNPCKLHLLLSSFLVKEKKIDEAIKHIYMAYELDEKEFTEGILNDLDENTNKILSLIENKLILERLKNKKNEI